MRVKDVIAKEEDLTVPLPSGVKPDLLDQCILTLNQHLDELDNDIIVMDSQINELDLVKDDVSELNEIYIDIVSHQEIEPEYPGLDEVSAEMIQIRLRSMARRRGIDTSRIYGVFSAESFAVSDPRIKRTRSEISLEGLADFLKGVWEKIKAVIRAIWEGLKNFWKKHFTILGSMEAELEKLKKEVQNKSGYPDATKEIKADSKLVKIFRPQGNLNIQDVGKMSANMNDATKICTKFLHETFNYMNSKFINNVKSRNSQKGEVFISENAYKVIGLDKIKFGSKEKPLAGGLYSEFRLESSGENQVAIIFEWKEADPVREMDDRLTQLATKDDCVKLIDECLKIVKNVKEYGKAFNDQASKTQGVANKLSNAVENIRDEGEDTKRQEAKTTVGDKKTLVTRKHYDNKNSGDIKKEYQANLKFFQAINSMLPKINNKIVKANIDTIRGSIKFIKIVMSALKKKQEGEQ